MEQNLNKTEFILASEDYERWGGNFPYELDWHHQNGWVIDTPYAFGMGYFYEDEGEQVLKVSYVRGDMKMLMRWCLNIIVDKIEFSRAYSAPDKRYNFERFISWLYSAEKR